MVASSPTFLTADVASALLEGRSNAVAVLSQSYANHAIVPDFFAISLMAAVRSFNEINLASIACVNNNNYYFNYFYRMSISQQQLMETAEKLFASIDTNGNGSLDRNEVREFS